MAHPEVPGLVAHLFRHQSGRLVALLTRALGARHLQLAEDVVQEALIAALHTWPLRGVPDNPPAWLLQVARRRAIDVLRRDRTFTDRAEPQLTAHLTQAEQSTALELDDTLALMFMTCHPTLPPESRIALTLKVAGGFGVEEIARGLFADPRAIAQRLVRAKRQLREEGLEVALPSTADLPARLESVLDSLVVMFTTGYGAGRGEALIHEDVCLEAVRLARLLVRHPHTATPESQACVALLLLQAARLPARVADSGDLTVLADQDHTRWLWPLVHEALHHLDRSRHGFTLSRWHLQAGIAALHATGAPFAATPWDRIVTLYDDLVRLQPTGVVHLNRAIALGMRDGPAAGLTAVRDVANDPRLANYHLLHAARGHFQAALGEAIAARESYTRALGCELSAPERRFLLGKIASLD
jgi:RNA polymerase sigma-70 factor (ECF subfamily)